MKNTKKVLSVALAGALAFGSMGAAFAAVPTVDANANKDVAAAVAKLGTLGMVAGMEDGKFHEEMKVTREQAAKLIVEALGLGNAAEAAKGATTQFSDVAADRWSAGYINVAAGQGLVKGLGDGTFGPDKEVSYAQVITMLVRALGYKDEFLKGTWPGNYVAKAAALDITDDVAFTPAGIADRGSVAIMLSNTLDAPVIKQDTFGDDNNWKEVDGKISGTKLTLLEDKLDIVKYEEMTLTGIPKVNSDVDAGQAKFDDEVLDLKEGLNVDSLLGANLDVYYDLSDKEVVYVEKSDKVVKEYYDVVDEDETISDTEITLKNSEKKIKLDDDTVFYVDNTEVDSDDFQDIVDNGNVFVKVVLNDKGKASVIDAYVWDKSALIAKSADANKITYVVDDPETTKELKLKDYDNIVVMDNTGKPMKMEDIKADDILYVNDKNDTDNDSDLEDAATKDEVAYVVVVRNKVEGKGQTWEDDSFEIDGKDYDVNTTDGTVSVNNDKDFVLYVDAETELDDITDADAKVVALLDINGDIRHMRTDVKSTSDDLYGIVTGVETKYDDTTIKVLNKEGKKVEYTLDVDDEDFAGGYDSDDDVAKYDVIKYTVDKDGNIDSIEKIADIDDVNAGTQVLDITKKSVQFELGADDKYYAADDSTVIFDYTAAFADGADDLADGDDAGDAEIVKWEDIKDKDVDPDTAAIYVLDGNKIEFMVFTDGFSAIADDDKYSGYVVSTRTKNGDLLADVKVAGSDKVERFTVKEADEDSVFEENVITFTKNSKGELVVADDMETATGKVTLIKGKDVTIDVDGDLATTADRVKYRLDSDVVYYEKDDAKDFSDLDEGDYVRFVVDEGYVKAVKLYDVDTKDAADSETVQYIADFDTDNGVDLQLNEDEEEFEVVAP